MQPLCLCLGIYAPSFAVQPQISRTPSLSPNFLPKHGGKQVCPRGATNVTYFPCCSRPQPSIQELCTEAGRYRGLFGTPSYPALVLVAQSYCHLGLPAGFTERQVMKNEQAHLEEPLSTVRTAATGGGGQRLGAGQCGQLQEGAPSPEAGGQLLPATGGRGEDQCPCRCLPRAPLLFSAISIGQWGRPWQCPRPHHQARSSLRLSDPREVPGDCGHFLPAFLANP